MRIVFVLYFHIYIGKDNTFFKSFNPFYFFWKDSLFINGIGSHTVILGFIDDLDYCDSWFKV